MTTELDTIGQRIEAEVNASLLERDSEVRAIMLGLVAREHVLLVGPPGTGKSAICRAVSQAIAGCRYCERLLSPTTPPEAVFGPISLRALREDRYEHVSEGSATDAEILFLDEFFRGSDAIRDTLLHLLGPERQALVGTRQVRAPLVTAIGASNSWSDSADQAAILDRWLIRRTVRPLSPGARARLPWADLKPVAPIVTLEELGELQDAAAWLAISDDARAAYEQILQELSAAGIRPSDRRVRASAKVARAAAALEGSLFVLPGHLESLTDVLWDVPVEQPEQAAEIITRIANPVGSQINGILRAVDEVIAGVNGDAANRISAVKKVSESERELTAISKSHANGRAKKALEYVRRERIRLQAAALGLDPEKAAALMGCAE